MVTVFLLLGSRDGNSKVLEAVKRALQLGYRHIDGASEYGNEKDIGEAIKQSGIPRKEIFVTSKLYVSKTPSPSSHYDHNYETSRNQSLSDQDRLPFPRPQTWHKPEDVQRALELSLRNLQLDYGDPRLFLEIERRTSANSRPLS